MAHNRKRNLILIISTILVLLIAAVFIGRNYVLTRIKEKVESQLYALRDSGYIVRYDSITVDTRKNRVAIYKLSIKRDLDTALCASTDFFSANFIKADGFSLLPLILKSKLKFKAIEIDSPRIVLYKTFFNQRENEGEERREFSIEVGTIGLPNMNFSYYDSSICMPSTTYTSNASIEDFVLSFYEDRQPYYNVSSVRADNINITLPFDHYNLSIRETCLNLAMGYFDLDTLRITPLLGKTEFGRKLGKQADRIEGVIPYINLYGLSLYHEDSIALKAQKMTAQLFLRVFRDKRLPFKNPVKPLPTEILHKLPFGLSLDSVIVNKSFVEYEEFAEEADSSGHLIFDNVYASVTNIDNTRKEEQGKANLVARSSFMGNGDLLVKAEMPWNPNRKTRITGSLTDMDFRKLNAILEPHAKMRIESGYLNALKFAFNYDDDASVGELDMRYSDLKVVTFRTDEQIKKKTDKQKKKGKHDEEDEEKLLKAPLKTFVVNTFILKSSNNGESEETRSGTIAFERDKHRSMFNYWAKSMFSGIKSAYNIDRLETSRLKKLVDKAKQ